MDDQVGKGSLSTLSSKQALSSLSGNSKRNVVHDYKTQDGAKKAGRYG